MFQALVSWLDQAAGNSILAGFTQLTDYAKSGGGFALSSDSSDFYLQRLESKNREMERDIRRGLLAPLIRVNFGPNAKIPKYKIDPLNVEDVAPQLTLLQAAFSNPKGPTYPVELIEEITAQVAQRWGLDVQKMRKAVQDAAAKAEAEAEQARADQQAQFTAKAAGALGEVARQGSQAAVRERATPAKKVPARKVAAPARPERS